MLRAKQGRIALGMATAAIVTAAMLLWPGEGDPAAAVPAALRALLSPAIVIAGAVGFIARARFFDSRAFDGGSGVPMIDLANRYLSNSIEQGVLAAMAWLAFAAALPARAAFLIPLLAILFLFARLLFAIGYAVAPSARALGFALTFYPSLGVLVMTLWHMSI